MFSEKFSTLMRELNIKSRELAEFMQCDKSYINRVRSGGRELSPSGRAAGRMSHGIFDYAAAHSLLPQLYILTGCAEDTPEPTARHQLYEWLFEGHESKRKIKKERKSKHKTTKTIDFSEKFKQVNALAGLSNIRLAKLLNVDPSLTSRWRSGLSQPRDENMQNRFCSELVKRIYAQNRAEDFARLLDISPDVSDTEEKAAVLLKAWLFTESDENNAILESFIAGFDNFSPTPQVPVLSFEEAVDDKTLNDDAKQYLYISGLQKAVLRFLGNAVKNSTKELWLYSDQNMNWMTGSKSFMLKWYSLMSLYLRNGGKIKIIHNVDRSFDEMTEAIKGWLPLYMTGGIISYYNTKPSGSRFFTTLFLAVDSACIYGSYITGSENKAEYSYYTEKERLDHYKTLYEILMKDCRELIKTEIMTPNKQFVETINEKKGVHVIQSTLSLATMPKELADSFCADMSKKDAGLFYREWDLQRRRYITNIENAFVNEYIPLPDDETLFEHKVSVDSSIPGLYYTPEQFSLHIKNIIAMTEKYANYKFVILPTSLLSHSRIIIGKKTVTVNHLTAPRMDLSITHPLMRAAFTVYAEDLYQQCLTSKKSELNKMKQYL